MSTKKHKKIWYSILGIVIVVILAAAVLFAAKFYPVALVGTKLIYAKDIENSYKVAQKLEPQKTILKSEILDQLIENTQKQKLTGKVSPDAELKYYRTGKNEEFTKFVRDYFSGDEKKFVKYVILPQVYDAQLRMKYNSNFGGNNDAYNKAENIINKLNKGETFEGLAKTNSDDKVSGQFGGDLGFVSEGQLLPELEKAVAAATVGEVKKSIVVSRLGYHIIYPVEVSTRDGVKVWHVKHILIQTQGYDNWLANQLKTVGVKKLMSI